MKQFLSKRAVAALLTIQYFLLCIATSAGAAWCIDIGPPPGKESSVKNLKCQSGADLCCFPIAVVEEHRTIPKADDCTKCYPFSFEQVTLTRINSHDLPPDLTLQVAIDANAPRLNTLTVSTSYSHTNINSFLPPPTATSSLQSIILII